jgi:sarcosine oxidase delta subunit
MEILKITCPYCHTQLEDININKGQVKSIHCRSQFHLKGGFIQPCGTLFKISNDNVGYEINIYSYHNKNIEENEIININGKKYKKC